MSDILRSILPDEPRGDDPKLMFQNYCALKESVLRFDLPAEINVFEYVEEPSNTDTYPHSNLFVNTLKKTNLLMKLIVFNRSLTDLCHIEETSSRLLRGE